MNQTMEPAARRFRMAEGDWFCMDPTCGNINFARRNKCNRCGKAKSGDPVPKTKLGQEIAKAGDPVPKTKLGQEIGKAAAEKSRGLFSADDWQCNKCGNVNWARRQQCNMCNAPKWGEVEERTGYGGGYNDRGVVEYIERNDSDDEYDEFGRKKKKKSQKADSESQNAGNKNFKKSYEDDGKEEDGRDEDEEDDDGDGDLSKYDLSDFGISTSNDVSRETKNDKEEISRNQHRLHKSRTKSPNSSSQRNRSRFDEEEEDDDDDEDISKYDLTDIGVVSTTTKIESQALDRLTKQNEVRRRISCDDDDDGDMSKYDLSDIGVVSTTSKVEPRRFNSCSGESERYSKYNSHRRHAVNSSGQRPRSRSRSPVRERS